MIIIFIVIQKEVAGQTLGGVRSRPTTEEAELGCQKAFIGNNLYQKTSHSEKTMTYGKCRTMYKSIFNYYYYSSGIYIVNKQFF